MTANPDSNNVSVLLGNRVGGFQVVSRNRTGDSPLDVAIGDLDGDGVPDLVSANRDTFTVSVLRGNGDGTFQAALDTSLDASPFSVDLYDTNADGRLDIVTSNPTSNSVSVLRGSGNLRFAAPVAYPVGANPRAVAFGDLTGDGIGDLISANSAASTLSLLPGQRDGSFGPATPIPTGQTPNTVVIADLNANGHNDLAVALGGAQRASVLLGYGDGTFAAARDYVVGTNPDSIAMGNFNRDGRLDLAVENFQSNTVTSLLSQPGEQPPPTVTPTPAPTATPLPQTPPEITGFQINGGALVTSSTDVTLTVSGCDLDTDLSRVHVSFSNDGKLWSGWQPLAARFAWQLGGPDGHKTVSARLIDPEGNISAVVTAQIQLDTTLQQSYGVSVNRGALFTNSVSVTLALAAPAQTAAMQISNDGGFFDAVWEPYSARRPWQITAYGNAIIPRVVYIRFRTVSGTISPTYQDDILLDVTPARGHIRVLPAAAQTNAGTASGSRVELVLEATDDVSGISDVRLSATPTFDGIRWEPFTARTMWATDRGGTVYAQFRDGAGNVSETASAVIPITTRRHLPWVWHAR